MSSVPRWFLSIALVFSATIASAADYAPGAGDCAVASLDAVWHDASRDRDVPVRIYYPTGEHAPKSSPVILFSHGLGGSREGYGYLGEAWAAHGYISVHLQHAGSDINVFKEPKRPLQKLKAFKAATTNPANFVNRPLDVAFAIERLTSLNGDRTFVFSGRFDLKRLGVAGHSFGAYTVMALAGQAFGSASSPRYSGPDPRIVAGIAMSSQPAAPDNLAHAYDKIAIPIFHLTGTKDESIGGHGTSTDDGGLGHTSAAGRRVAFDHTTHAPAYLLTFKDGDHMVFSGRDANGPSEGMLRKLLGATEPSILSPELRERMHHVIVAATVAFWEAVLRDNGAARQWFEGKGLQKELAELGTFERKTAVAAATLPPAAKP